MKPSKEMSDVLGLINQGSAAVEKTIKLYKTIIITAWLVGLGILGAIGYTAIHFISKFW